MAERYIVINLTMDNGRRLYFIVDDLINKVVGDGYTRRDKAEKMAKKLEKEMKEWNAKK